MGSHQDNQHRDDPAGSNAATSIGSNETSAASNRTSATSQMSLHTQTRQTSHERVLELIRYLLFVILLSIVAYSRNYDYVKHQWVYTLSQHFTPKYDWINTDSEMEPAFGGVTSVVQLWRFLDHFASCRLLPDNGTTSYDGSYLIGSVLLQQKRVKPGPCPKAYKEIFPQAPESCPSPTFENNLAQEPFGRGDRFSWTDQYQKDANFLLPTALGKYGVGGYNSFLTQDVNANRELIRSLMSNQWIDPYTVAILLDFSVYSLNGNRICVIRLLFELPSYGGVKATSNYQVIDAFPYDRWSNQLIAAFEVIFVLYCLDMLLRMVQNFRLSGKQFFMSLWNVMDVVNFPLVATAIVSRVIHDVVVPKLASACEREPYVDWQNVAAFERVIRRVTSVVVIISWLRIAKYLLTMSNGLRMIKRVFIAVSINLAMFVAFLTIVLMGYVHAFFLAFHIDIPQFRSMEDSFLTAYGSIFGPGKFSFEEVQHSNFLLGPILAFAFFLSVELLLGHMFAAIVHGSYHDHRLAEKDVHIAKLIMAEIGSAMTTPTNETPKLSFLTKTRNVLQNIFSTKTNKIKPDNS